MKRFVNCDVLRILAFSLVIAVHFLLYNGFYNTVTLGKTMLLTNIFRCIFIVCVPLFIVLTGYLMKNKTFDKSYCMKICKILLSYIICSVVCSIAICLIKENTISIKGILTQVLDFSGAPYAWYVNMYIGLYFFIPFLNELWNNLDDKNKKWLIIMLFVFVILPTLFNLKYNIMPGYWCGIAFPMVYYFVGCYLRDFPINISISKNILILILLVISFGVFNYIKCYNALFDWGDYSGYFSFQAFFVTIFLSNLILNLKINIKNDKTTKFLALVSKLTFSAYLLSAIFDIYFYDNILPKLATNFNEKIVYFVPFVLGIGVCSLLGAYVVDLFEKTLKRSFKWIKEKLNKILKKQTFNNI